MAPDRSAPIFAANLIKSRSMARSRNTGIRFIVMEPMVVGNLCACDDHQRGTFVPFPESGIGLTMSATHTLNHKDCPICKQANALAVRKKSMQNLGLIEAG